MATAEHWTQERNLSLLCKRELLIYLLGRLNRETLPQDLLVFLAENLFEVVQVDGEEVSN